MRPPENHPLTILKGFSVVSEVIFRNKKGRIIPGLPLGRALYFKVKEAVFFKTSHGRVS